MSSPKVVLAVFIIGSLFVWIFGDIFSQSESNENGQQTNERLHGLHLGNDSKHLHWFVQVSDIHISMFHSPERYQEFEDFCEVTLNNIIRPEVVLVTGDLTDAKLANKQGSKQSVEEWRIYEEVLRKTAVYNKTVWLDIRGNHDAFDVPSLESVENYYKSYSHRGKSSRSHFRYEHRTPTDSGTYGFIAVDACPDPGPRRPFNFFGVLTEADLVELEGYAEESKNDTFTVWFGHYPTSTIGSESPGIQSILSHGAVYVCGHLHTLFGAFGERLYTRHSAGNLELEIGDWMNNRIYRVFAVDHGLFSFVDQTYGVWPVVLVTNPKEALFNIPNFEPTSKQLKSTHIRILVFSGAKIRSVQVTIDGRFLGNASQVDPHLGGPLYVLPWQPHLYLTGLHTIQVKAIDMVGRERLVKQKFSLDNTQPRFNLFSNYVLLVNHATVAKCLYFVLLLSTILPPILLRLCRRRIMQGALSGESRHCMAKCAKGFLRQGYLLASNNRLFYFTLAFNVYITVGPWFVGEIMSSHIGACFVFGLAVRGVFIPGTLTYIYGIIQLLTFNIPLQLYLGRCLDLALSDSKTRDDGPKTPLLMKCCPPPCRKQRVLRWIIHHWPFIFLISLQSYLAYSGTYMSYGLMAFLLCPVRTWSVPFAIYLRWLALTAFDSLHKEVTVGHVDS